jgi:ribonuclease HI
MAKRRKKKVVRIIYQSPGPLPARIAEQYAGLALVFSDASARRNGGLAVVLFSTPDAEAIIATQTVPLDASNALEFQAALFALLQACKHFPGQPFALFTDNRDAADRLQRAKIEGVAQDAELARRLTQLGIVDAFAHASISWIKGHASCRGNTLADQHAAEAAS